MLKSHNIKNIKICILQSTLILIWFISSVSVVTQISFFQKELWYNTLLSKKLKKKKYYTVNLNLNESKLCLTKDNSCIHKIK